MSGHELIGWPVVAVAVAACGVVLVVLVQRRHRKRRAGRLRATKPPRRSPRPGDAAVHDLSRLRPPAGDADPAPAEPTAPAAVPDLYPGVPDTHLLTECPTVDAMDGPMPLRDWRRHLAGPDAWSEVVSRFYDRAAADPDIASYFTGVDLARLQRHSWPR